MDNTFSMWDSLLKKLTAHQEQFLIILVDEMAIQISSPSTMDTRIDPHREAITMWLEHICSAKDWAAAVKRGKLSYSALLSTCLQNPNHWTIHLASSIINTPGCKEAKAIYKDRVAGAVADQAHLVRSVARTSFIESPDRLQSSERACGEVQPQENWELSRPMLRNSLEDSEIGGWHKWKGTWVSKPIGMI